MLDRQGRPLHGTILWNTGELKVKEQDLEVLEELVRQGTSVVLVGDAIANPAPGRVGGSALR